MSIVTKCLNEWNATIEALGHGNQSLLIRKYGTTLENFLLYPTVSYTKNKDFLQSFRTEFQSFVKKNATPIKQGNKYEVKYYAEVEKIIERTPNNIMRFKNFHIWTNKHVKSYLENYKAYIWILRVYKLKEPVFLERSRGLRYANTLEEVSLEGMEPVLTDSEFNKILDNIK